MENLENEIKKIIIEVANLEGMTIDDIDNDTPLFGEELGFRFYRRFGDWSRR